jgi:hypothetical protein
MTGPRRALEDRRSARVRGRVGRGRVSGGRLFGLAARSRTRARCPAEGVGGDEAGSRLSLLATERIVRSRGDALALLQRPAAADSGDLI